jgi:tetratricopeptide (TPR) repeat protein
MPDIAGGDLDLAIEMMRQARDRAPKNPRYAPLLAAYLLDTGENQEARTILTALLDLQPEINELQITADQLRIAADIAGRIPDVNLAQRLSSRRCAMLDMHPYLQKRHVVAALGHFGDNPLDD